MDLITFGLFLAGVLIVASNIAALYWFGSLLIPLIAGGAPYVPTRPEVMERMLRLAHIQPNDVVVDLGSGDGRLVVAAMTLGARRGVGYEIHPGLVRLSNWNLRRAGFADTAEVLNRSMWNADLGGVTLVFLYQIPYAMKRMKNLLESQLAPGSRVVSHAFKIPGWEPEEIDGNVLMYKIK